MKSVPFDEGELVGAKTGEIDGVCVGESGGGAVLGGNVGTAELVGGDELGDVGLFPLGKDELIEDKLPPINDGDAVGSFVAKIMTS